MLDELGSLPTVPVPLSANFKGLQSRGTMQSVCTSEVQTGPCGFSLGTSAHLMFVSVLREAVFGYIQYAC